MDQIVKISGFILEAFLHIWPYLLISIPLAVAVQVSGASKYINKALSQKPLIAIFLATVVGAFSPFCSCGVIPVIASLLIGGVPLAPVMAFWIASPSMDPEIFFLSTATIGFKLSVWRLGATFGMSLFAGYFTHYALLKGFLGNEILRKDLDRKNSFQVSTVLKTIKNVLLPQKPANTYILQMKSVSTAQTETLGSCNILVEDVSCELPEIQKSGCGCSGTKPPSRMALILKESRKATFMVIKFMFLAFFVNALITLYVPQEFITASLGGQGFSTIFSAALIGVPAYTTNITALPLISGLLSLGMNPGAALAFLIAGPTTTLPAMVAVYGMVKRRIFLLYLSFSLAGAVFFGIFFNLIN